MCTITRVAGVRTSSSDSSLDTIWQTYWQFITADIALIMTAATAFRAFFISKHEDRAAQGHKAKEFWLIRSLRWLKMVLSSSSRRTKTSVVLDPENLPDHHMELPQIEERATMTGIRTFINHQGEDDDELDL